MSEKPAKRTLDDAARRRAFWIVAPVIGAAIVALSLLAGPRSTSNPAQPAATATTPASDGPIIADAGATSSTSSSSATPSSTTPAQPAGAPDAEDRAAIVAQATTFMRAMLRYEVGRGGRRALRTFRRTATPALAERLRSQPPRQPIGMNVPMGRITSLELSDDHRARPIIVAVSIDRGGRISPLQLLFVHRRGTWLVDALA